MLLNNTSKMLNTLNCISRTSSKNIIINLIGSKTPVEKSAHEIKRFTEEKGLHVIIIDDAINVFTEIYNYNPNVIINKCGILNCRELYMVNYMNAASSLNTYTNYNFLIHSNICNMSKEEKNNIRRCEYLDDVYNLDLHVIDKKNMVNMYLY